MHSTDCGLLGQGTVSAPWEDDASAPPRRPDVNQISLFAATVCDFRAGPYEIRAYSAYLSRGIVVPGKATVGALYSRLDSLSCDVERIEVAAYLCPNPALPFAARNCLDLIRRGEGVSNERIGRLRWLYIDLDSATKPADENSTDAELAACIAVRDRILADHAAIARSALSLTTGNGAGLLLRLPDYPNDRDHSELTRAVLRSLDARYTDGAAKIDTNTAAPSRGVGIPGTLKTKGSHTPERPRRRVSLDNAGAFPVAPTGLPEPYHQRLVVEPIDLRAWLAENPPPERKRSVAFATPAPVTLPTLPAEYDALCARMENYAEATLRHECDGVRTATPGTRNHRINKAAYKIGGLVPTHLNEQTARAELIAAGLATELPKDEVEAAVDAGMVAGMQKPWNPPIQDAKEQRRKAQLVALAATARNVHAAMEEMAADAAF